MSTQLEEAVNHAKDERPFLVDGLLYEKGALLMSGDPGAGKSLVMLSALLECTGGLPVFSQLPCARPLNCYILFSERINQEALERIRLMRAKITLDYKRLVLDDGFVGIADVTKRNFADEIIERISNTPFPDNGDADIVGLDSLYGFIPGGLSKDEKASEFSRFIARLQSELGACSWLVHHTSRPTYATQGERIDKDDPYYGSQWLKAMVTGSYYLRRHGTGVQLVKKKDTFGALLSELPLDYDPETHVVSLPSEYGTLKANNRAIWWLRGIATQEPTREFTFEDFCKAINVSHQHGRRLLKEPTIARLMVIARKDHPRIFYHAVLPTDSTSDPNLGASA